MKKKGFSNFVKFCRAHFVFFFSNGGVNLAYQDNAPRKFVLCQLTDDNAECQKWRRLAINNGTVRGQQLTCHLTDKQFDTKMPRVRRRDYQFISVSNDQLDYDETVQICFCCHTRYPRLVYATFFCLTILVIVIIIMTCVSGYEAQERPTENPFDVLFWINAWNHTT